MKIKEMEERTGLTRANIWFYERRGLLCPEREENNYRDYTEEDVERLELIVLLRRMNFSIETIGELLDGTQDLQDALAQSMEELEQQKKQLEGSIALCEIMWTRQESMDTLSVWEYKGIMKQLEQDGKWFRELAEDAWEDLWEEERQNSRLLKWFPQQEKWYPQLVLISGPMVGVLWTAVLSIWSWLELRMLPYTSKGYLIMVADSVILSIVCVVEIFLLALVRRKFPEGKEKYHRYAHRLYRILSNIMSIIVCVLSAIVLVRMVMRGYQSFADG